MKLTSIWAAISLLLLTTYAAVIPSTHYTKFDWPKNSSSKKFALDTSDSIRVQVTDLGANGEGFMVYDNNNFLGETSDQSLLETNEKFRQGFFNLDKGHHIIKLKLKGTSTGQGSGAIRIVSGTA